MPRRERDETNRSATAVKSRQQKRVVRNIPLVWMLILCFWVGVATGDEARKALVIFVSPDDDRDYQLFKQAVDVQLSDVGVAVRLTEVSEGLPLRGRARAEELLRQEDALVAVLATKDTLSLPFDDGKSRNRE